MRVQGWDPVLIICQIISLQTIHYLSLSILTPPILSTFTDSSLLSYSGGSNAVAHILDWREMAARPTITSSSFPDLGGTAAAEGWRKLRGAWAGGKQVGTVTSEDGSGSLGGGVKGSQGVDDELEEVWDFGVDDKRGWIIALLWIFACGIDIAPLYWIVRRPTHILDFSLTLTFIHLILTTYYAKSFPSSIFFWVIQALGALMMVTVAEQLCVKREMNTDLSFGGNSEWDPNYENGLGDEEEAIPLNSR